MSTADLIREYKEKRDALERNRFSAFESQKQLEAAEQELHFTWRAMDVDVYLKNIRNGASRASADELDDFLIDADAKKSVLLEDRIDLEVVSRKFKNATHRHKENREKEKESAEVSQAAFDTAIRAAAAHDKELEDLKREGRGRDEIAQKQKKMGIMFP